MTVLANTSVSWTQSPRIITIDSAYTDITVVDIHETLLDLEDSVEGILWEDLRATSGGEALGGGVTVGVTTELQNAQIAFEARTTPLQSGTATSNASNTADGFITLTDTSATFQDNLVARGDLVINVTDGSQATVVSVTDQQNLIATALTGGTGNDFAISDVYDVYDIVQCSVSGGNLVAVDAVDAELSPFFPTFGTQIVRTASSSATTQSLTTIERAAFNEAVWLDQGNTTGNATAGTTYPTGTSGQPCLTFADAKILLTAQGFVKINVYGDFTAPASSTLSSVEFDGISTENHIHLDEAGVVFTDCGYRNLHFHGAVAGTTQMHDCEVADVTGFSGELMDCTLEDNTTVTMAAGGEALIIHCVTGVGNVAAPILNCNGDGDFAIQGHSGDVTIANKTSGSGDVNMASGHAMLASSCTGGTIEVKDQAHVMNMSAGTVVQTEALSQTRFDNIQYHIEFLKQTHQITGETFIFVPGGGLAGNDGKSINSPLQTFAQCKAKCTSGANDAIFAVNPTSGSVDHAEDIVMDIDNLHFYATSRDITFKPASSGGTVIDVTANNCSVFGHLIDGDKAGGTTANYCITVSGKFPKIQSVWVKQAVLDGILIDNGDYCVLENIETEKNNQHGLAIIDSGTNPASGDPREVTLTGRNNIYLNGGAGIYIAGDGVSALGATTRIIRMLSANIHDNTGFGIEATNLVDKLLLGTDIINHDNNGGHTQPQTNILAPDYHDEKAENMESQTDEIVASTMGVKVDNIHAYMALDIGDYVDIDDTTNQMTSQLGTFVINITEPTPGTKRFTRAS